MPAKPTVDSYLALVQRSGLVDAQRLKAVVAELRERGAEPAEADRMAEALVQQRLLTAWQAQTLLKGRYKGFHLGKYRLLDLLGSGGMGSVYLAEHVLMRRKVAIKVLPPKRVGNKAYLQRFYREARAVAQFDHPNIVRAYDVDQDGDIHFIVMEYVEGTSLFKLVKTDGPLAVRQAADYVRQAAEGLAHAAQEGLVHRDIKPSNLLVDSRGTVKLLDLGLARFFQEKDEEPLTTNLKQGVLGTVDYLAPEQALNSHAVDARADIYSLGCTFYFLLTGQPPFPDGAMAQRLLDHQTRPPPPVRRRRPDVPEALAAMIEKMMAKDPELRYQTPRDLVAALAQWLQSEEAKSTTQRSPQTASPHGASAAARSDAWRSRTAPPPAGASRMQQTEEPGSASDVETELGSGPHPVPPKAAAARRDRATSAPLPSSSSADAADYFARPAVGPSAPAADDELAKFLAAISQQQAARDASTGSAAASETGTGATGLAPAGAVAPAGQPAPRGRSENSSIPSAADSESEGAWWMPPAPAGSEPSPMASRLESLGIADLHAATPISESGSAVGVSVAAGGVDFASLPPVADAPLPVFAPPPFSRPRPESPRRKPRNVKSGADSRRRQILLGAALSGSAVLIAVGLLVFARPSANPPANTKGPDPAAGPSKEREGPSQAGRAPSAATPTPRRPQVIVDPSGGDFRTLADALAEAEDGQVIRVVGGRTYQERILMDGEVAADDLRLEALGGRVTLKAPPGSEPLLRLHGVRGLQIRGFDLQADSLEVAIELEGVLPGVELKDLTVSGFSRAGLVGKTCQGQVKKEILLEKMNFQPNPQAADAVAILFRQGAAASSSDAPVNRVKIRQCRFDPPWAQAVRFEMEANNVEIAECLFAGGEQGVRFDAPGARWQFVSLWNNTFFKLQRGVAFAQMPADGSHDLAICNNLFYDLSGPAAQVEQRYDAGRMARQVWVLSPAGASHNWESRAADANPPTTAPDASAGILPLFETRGRRQSIELLSLDPAHPDFLRPPRGSPLSAAGARGKLHAYVGALEPGK